MISGRLLYLEWLGAWRNKQWWKALCDCGKTVEVVWRPGDTMSCGCQKREQDRQRDFTTQRTDGTWGLKNKLRLKLADGRETTVADLARQVGSSLRAMHWRIKQWPEHRWLEPVQFRGKRDRRILIRQKNAERVARRPQPWASANIRSVNKRGLNLPKARRGAAAVDGQALAAGSVDVDRDRQVDPVVVLVDQLVDPEGGQVGLDGEADLERRAGLGDDEVAGEAGHVGAGGAAADQGVDLGER